MGEISLRTIARLCEQAYDKADVVSLDSYALFRLISTKPDYERQEAIRIVIQFAKVLSGCCRRVKQADGFFL